MGKPKIGLALGGGAARGWAHIGVIKTLKEAGLEPDIIAGTSIGAVAGGCYAADKIEPLEEFACSLTRRSIFGFLDFNFGGSGLITGQRLCDRLDGHLDQILIQDLPHKYVAVATEFGTGHEVWLSKGRLVDAMRASYALPGIFRPVKINGRWLMDGALVNPIPVSVCRALGARVVIAVNLNWDVFGKGAIIPNHEAIDEAEEAVAETPLKGLNGKAATRLLHRQFFGRQGGEPSISAVMMDAFNIIQDRIARARLAGDPPDITIMPRMSDIKLFDFYQAEKAIQLGAEAAEKQLDDISQIVSAL
jgi:NTE family protein